MFDRSIVIYTTFISVIFISIFETKGKEIIVEMCSVRLNKNALQIYSLFLLLFRINNYCIYSNQTASKKFNKTTNYLKKEIQLIIITFIYKF